MTIGNRSQLRISRLAHYLGVGPNWDASILLKGKSSTAEDVFTIEFCNETKALRCGDEFVLRAYNGYYVAVSDRVFCACARGMIEATRFSVYDDSGRNPPPSYDRDLILFAAQKPIAVPLLEGGKLTIAETGEDLTAVVLQQCGVEGATIEQSEDGAAPASSCQVSESGHMDDDEWLNEEDISLSAEEHHIEEVPDDRDPRDGGISTVEEQPLVSPREELMMEHHPLGTEPSLEPAIYEAPPSINSPSLESVRDRLEGQLQRLLEVRKIECQLANECNQLMDRCEQLQASVPRIIDLTAQREHLRKSLDEITRQLPDGAIQAFDAELEILDRMRQWLSVFSSHKDSLSATLQQTIIENQRILEEVAALQVELESKRGALAKQREQSDLLCEEMKPHLDANIRISTAVPGAKNCVDLLRKAEWLLEESDQLLANLIRQEDQAPAVLHTPSRL